MLNDEVDKVTERFFKSLMKIHQNKLEESMKGSEFVIDNVHLLYCKYRKINLSCVGLQKHFPYWIKNKKATKNPIDKKDKKLYQWDVTVSLNQDETKKHLQRTTKIKPFENKYNWEGINFP